jgi:hypothetical protein
MFYIPAGNEIFMQFSFAVLLKTLASRTKSRSRLDFAEKDSFGYPVPGV